MFSPHEMIVLRQRVPKQGQEYRSSNQQGSNRRKNHTDFRNLMLHNQIGWQISKNIQQLIRTCCRIMGSSRHIRNLFQHRFINTCSETPTPATALSSTALWVKRIKRQGPIRRTISDGINPYASVYRLLGYFQRRRPSIAYAIRQ